MRMMKVAREEGSSLIEALVSTLIMTTGVLTMAHLVSVATATNMAARHDTVATIVAEQKLEELLAWPWESLQPSPSSTLRQDTDGYVDHIGIYTRRWSIEPVSAGPESALTIQVLVIAASSTGRRQAHGDARLVTVRAR
jgi:hypothetical protein